MNKIKIFFISLISLLLVSCSPIKIEDEDIYSNTISKPITDLSIQGIWNVSKQYNLNENANNNDTKKYQEFFISKKVVQFEDAFILDPNISSRYVNLSQYLTNKITELSEEISIDKEMVTIYKISNNLSTSFELIEIDENKLLTIYLGKVFILEKNNDLDEEQIASKYDALKLLSQSTAGFSDKEFGLAISFRERDTSITDYFKYNYYTYFFKKTDEEIFPKIIKVNDIVVPKNIGLWTIKQEFLEETSEAIRNFRLSANPTFIEEDLKVNNIQDNYFRRIDYVNNDFIGVTNFMNTGRSIAESHSIFNMHELASNKPLSVTEIAGNDGNRIYQTAFKEVSNQLLSNDNMNVLSINPNPRNIGIERDNFNWKFISNLDIETSINTGSRFSRQFDLNINPIISIGQSSNTSITWRDILSRRPGAIDATVSPDSSFILIQNSNSIEIYPIIYNFIGTKSLFSIQNVDNYEIVSINWIQNENIDSYYDEYNRLEKLNNFIIMPN